MDDAAAPPSPHQALLDDRFAQLYGELETIARARLRRSGGAGLTSTGAVVHECWMRLRRADALRFSHEGEFLALAAAAMRSLIIDMARHAQAQRRGGGVAHVTLGNTLADALADAPTDEPEQLLAVDQALQQLAQLDHRGAQVVEMRFFAGLEDAQIAAALNISERTVRRDWERSRAYLALALRA